MVFSLRAPRLSLVLLHWHFAQILVSGFNWRFFISKETSLLGEDLPRTHIAFCIIGMIVWLLIASVYVYWPYRYGSFLLRKSRRNKMMFGSVLVYFVHVLPCWIIEFGIVWDSGWHTTLQSLSFMFLTISWIFETLAVWYGYMWHMAGFMQRYYSNTIFGRGGR